MKLFSVFIVFCGVTKYVLSGKHLLISLLSLEMMVLGLYFSLSILGFFYGSDFKYLFYFITMSVCGGVLGLSLLVCCSCSAGNDYLSSYVLLN
uniref:NADH dehydrogenase subunit 4L n=1 Tax=Crangonyx forbesi TaxID=111557 RepID=A0A6C0X4Z2_9CRUS|nr:NADH dehydrogenase subunit 4L [Crangonyx forbesi]